VSDHLDVWLDAANEVGACRPQLIHLPSTFQNFVFIVTDGGEKS